MPRQTEIFDEMDRLRDEVRELEEAGERLANALTEEREKTSRLEQIQTGFHLSAAGSFPRYSCSSSGIEVFFGRLAIASCALKSREL